MRPQFLHHVSNSFKNWFEFELLNEGRAFRNVSGLLYRMDSEFSNKTTYSSPYGQWNHHAEITGSYIPSGVYSGSTFIPRGTDGLILDFEHGRAIFDSGVNGTFTAAYAVKDLNVYLTTKPDDQLLFEGKQTFRPKFSIPATGIDPNRTYGPLIYIKRDTATNEPWAIGGEDCTHLNFRAIVLADNEYLVDAVGSIFIDSARKNFVVLDNSPLNRYGDIRTGDTYNYINDTIANYDSRKLICITDVDYYRFDSKTETSLNSAYYCGFLEFQCEIPRFPRI